MPLYEYKCKSCSYEFEKVQGIKEKPISMCPKCKKKVKRLVSGGNQIIYKTDGFYYTDYKRKGK